MYEENELIRQEILGYHSTENKKSRLEQDRTKYMLKINWMYSCCSESVKSSLIN